MILNFTYQSYKKAAKTTVDYLEVQKHLQYITNNKLLKCQFGLRPS